MISNAWGLAQAVSFLIEIRGIGLAETHFQRRVATALLATTSIIQTAADHADEIKRTLDDARGEFASSTDDIIVTFKNDVTVRNYTFVSRATGEIVHEPVRFRPTTDLQADLTRARPAGYLIPKPWAPIAEKLKVLGVEVETLDEEWEGSVEALRIASIDFATTYFEGALLANATTDAAVKSVKVPKGSFYVSARQRNAALAFVALEPESVDSYVTHNVIPVRKGDQYPIFRVL